MSLSATEGISRKLAPTTPEPVRTLSRTVAQAYYESREKLGFPMVRAS